MDVLFLSPCVCMLVCIYIISVLDCVEEDAAAVDEAVLGDAVDFEAGPEDPVLGEF